MNGDVFMHMHVCGLVPNLGQAGTGGKKTGRKGAEGCEQCLPVGGSTGGGLLLDPVISEPSRLYAVSTHFNNEQA